MSPCLVQYQGGFLVCKCPGTVVETCTIARQVSQAFLQALCKSARVTERGTATGRDSYLDKPPLQAHETGTVIVCGPCTNPSASLRASAGWLYANAKTPAATFASLVRPSADVRTLNCCRDWHVAREEPVQDLCRCVRPEMWSRLAPSKGPSQGRPRLNLHRKSPQARAPHMLSESSIMQTLQGFTPVPPCVLPRWYPCISMQHRFVTVLKHLSASFDARLYRCMPMPEL